MQRKSEAAPCVSEGVFFAAAAEIIAAGKFLAAKGWAPATSGNYSMRLEDGRIAMTVSGHEKGELTAEAIMLLDKDGSPLDKRTPSAEAALHVDIYQARPECRAVLHTHSQGATVFTRRHSGLNALELTDYEFLKVYPGIHTHDARVEVPIFANTQDMPALRAAAAPHVRSGGVPAYLIRSHGLYGWGNTMAQARRVVEATEFMIACELELRR